MKKLQSVSLFLACNLLLLITENPLSAAQYTAPGMEHVAGLIREEGLNSSQIMETLSYLTDVIGPRLTGSPNHKRANEWTRDKLACWGLTNAHLEAFGPFGRGWSLKSFSAQIVEPQTIPLLAYPKAWSKGLDRPIVADVIYFNPTNNTDLDRFKGKLKGAVVLLSPVRDVRQRFEPLATRLTETNLLRLANAGIEARGTYGSRSTAQQTSGGAGIQATAATNTAPPRASNATTNPPMARTAAAQRNLKFLTDEGAAVLVSASPSGDGGIVFVGSASTLGSERPWSTNEVSAPAQVTLASEDYNRLVRMLQQGEKLKMAVELRVQFHDDDLKAYNTVAEIPGTDLKDEVVMVGGHLDSWHAGTGATDNAIGVAAAMEAARIIKTLKLQPRRTIRIALWAGEEQGLLGSKAYVAQHLGYYTNLAQSGETPMESSTAPRLRAPKEEPPTPSVSKQPPKSSNSRRLVRLPEYEKLSAYFNLDNGAGRIRGIHLQANEAAGPYFRRWLEPFKDLDADTVTLSNTRGTDHLSFDAIGLPGFQFIQDPLDYNTRTHHSNQDVLERVVAEDARQAAVILSAFVYNAAMINERLPRKAVD